MAVNVGDLLLPQYNVTLVGASYVISVLGSFLALVHASHMYEPNGKLNPGMAVGAAISLGGVGIWAMHFVGMMGFVLPAPVVYEADTTALSLVAAIVIAGVALLLASRRGKFSWGGWTAGSLLAGTGVCVMHYLGMSAMSLRARMDLDAGTVGISFAIAVAASGAALWLAFHAVRLLHQVVAAFVMGVAVCSMHYVGMSAATFICIAQSEPPRWAIHGTYLPQMVFSITGLVFVFLVWNLFGFVINADNRKRARSRERHAQALQQKSADRETGWADTEMRMK